MKENTLYFSYVKKSLIGFLIIMGGFGLDYYFGISIGKLLMLGGIVAIWWYQFKAARLLYYEKIANRKHSKKRDQDSST